MITDPAAGPPPVLITIGPLSPWVDSLVFKVKDPLEPSLFPEGAVDILIAPD